jgi:hypothetical protein
MAAREQVPCPRAVVFFASLVARSIISDSSITSVRYLRRNANRTRNLMRTDVMANVQIS